MNNIFSTTQIGLAHFNNKTLQQNRDWKKEKEWNGAVYGFQYFIPDKIPYNTYLYIIEMNNDTNQIVGIGFIKKQQHTEWRSRIYKDCQDYNRFVIKSKYHRNRQFLLNKNKKLVFYLENILFKGRSHLKRTSNFTLSLDKIATFPKKTEKKAPYLCSICGKPKKGHICSGKKAEIKKVCQICGKIKYKGNSKKHVCIKKNYDKVNELLKFLRELFI